MLKSTYKTVTAPSSPSPLPPGWTEHKAPTGHPYYYNAQTKQSTYTRPIVPAPDPPTNHAAANGLSEASSAALGGTPFLGVGHQPTVSHRQSGDFRGGRSYQDRSRKPDNDRPKTKQTIPGAEPWILVKTKLGRRFVYHPEKNESFWKFPQDVLLAVIQLDHDERERKERGETGVDANNEEKTAESQPAAVEAVTHNDVAHDEGSDSYEEVEVTDDELGDDAPESKRHKADGDEAPGAVDFGEEDMEYQLAAMGEDYGLEPEEYGDNEIAGEEEVGGLSQEDATALFRDMLDDFHINPYWTWEKIIEDGHIVDDDRYTVLPNTRTRKEVFNEWSNNRIQELKERRLKEEKKDPKIPYLRFLHEHATPKLYWPEFKRKYKKEAEMRETRLGDKDREKLYRDHISRLKLPESIRKSDLSAMLKSQSLRNLNRSSTLATLPPAVLTDLRFISLPAKSRDPLVEAFIATLPAAPETEAETLTTEELAAEEKRKVERERRERAMAEREKMVQEQKRKQQGALRFGKGLLREGEMELDEAMKVNKDSLRAYAPENISEDQSDTLEDK